jgi:hypothetical protein
MLVKLVTTSKRYQFHALFHVHVEFSCSFSGNFVELLLFFHSLLIHSFPSHNVVDIGVGGSKLILREEFLHSFRLCYLRILKQRSYKRPKRDPLSLTPQRYDLNEGSDFAAKCFCRAFVYLWDLGFLAREHHGALWSLVN